MDRWNRSEGEGGLQDSTLDGIASEARGVLDVEVRRGDRNVVGDLELVPDFPSEGGLVAFEESVVGADEGRLTNSSTQVVACLLYTSPSPRDATLSRMPSSA